MKHAYCPIPASQKFKLSPSLSTELDCPFRKSTEEYLEFIRCDHSYWNEDKFQYCATFENYSRTSGRLEGRIVYDPSFAKGVRRQTTGAKVVEPIKLAAVKLLSTIYRTGTAGERGTDTWQRMPCSIKEGNLKGVYGFCDRAIFVRGHELIVAHVQSSMAIIH